MTNKGLILSALGGTDVYLMTVNCGENSDEQLPGRRLWGGVGLLQGVGICQADGPALKPPGHPSPSLNTVLAPGPQAASPVMP